MLINTCGRHVLVVSSFINTALYILGSRRSYEHGLAQLRTSSIDSIDSAMTEEVDGGAAAGALFEEQDVGRPTSDFFTLYSTPIQHSSSLYPNLSELIDNKEPHIQTHTHLHQSNVISSMRTMVSRKRCTLQPISEIIVTDNSIKQHWLWQQATRMLSGKQCDINTSWLLVINSTTKMVADGYSSSAYLSSLDLNTTHLSGKECNGEGCGEVLSNHREAEGRVCEGVGACREDCCAVVLIAVFIAVLIAEQGELVYGAIVVLWHCIHPFPHYKIGRLYSQWNEEFDLHSAAYHWYSEEPVSSVDEVISKIGRLYSQWNEEFDLHSAAYHWYSEEPVSSVDEVISVNVAFGVCWEYACYVKSTIRSGLLEDFKVEFDLSCAVVYFQNSAMQVVRTQDEAAGSLQTTQLSFPSVVELLKAIAIKLQGHVLQLLHEELACQPDCSFKVFKICVIQALFHHVFADAMNLNLSTDFGDPRSQQYNLSRKAWATLNLDGGYLRFLFAPNIRMSLHLNHDVSIHFVQLPPQGIAATVRDFDRFYVRCAKNLVA
ncbi:hypothetical protein PR048_018734 [Dryococelus australis]|uniref:Uncharacterized protein n=1 Tax=Dryococelus australis TaxID=614101 RepID=A0ABQ9HDI2_9NEOP|nr:hypothetical protein PR048_018734 [Dryococelus australis]